MRNQIKIIFLLIIETTLYGQTKIVDKKDAILQKAKEYCLRLDKAVLDFVCLEQVEEAVNRNKSPQTTPTILPGPQGIGPNWNNRPPRLNDFFATVYVYDYQFIRKGSAFKEHRDLLEKDGMKANKEETTPETKHFKFRDIFFGASILLGAEVQSKYQYQLCIEEDLGDASIAAIICEPIPSIAQQALSGKALIRIKDGAVLRIDWDPESFGSYDEVWAVADRLGMKPKLRSYTEFGIEKNGVRFPTLDYTEEAYSKTGKDIYVRSKTTVKYKNYKFFTVETKIDI